jgi:methylmalonyl-CoA epimerase
MGMMSQLTHIGIAVRKLEAAEGIYRDLGLAVSERMVAAQEGIRLAFVVAGAAAIELLEPLGPDGALGRFLSSRGEGVHHIAFKVRDIEQAMASARMAGLRLIDERPRGGSHGTRVVFIHPGSAHGVLLELVEEPG